MRIPFHRELDDLFRSDRAIWLKMGGCALATAFIVTATTMRGVHTGQLPISLSWPRIAVLILASTAVGAILAIALSLKDIVLRRIRRGEAVAPLLRLYFGMGVRSLLAWFLTALIVAFFMAIVIAIATLE